MGRPKSKYRIALDNLDKNVWYTLEEIQLYIESTVDLTPEDYELCGKNATLTVWMDNLHSCLAKMKLRNNLLHKDRIAAVNSLDGLYHPPLYMFIDKEPTNRKPATISGAKYKDAIKKLPPDVWMTIPDIIDYVKPYLSLEPHELEYSEAYFSSQWEHKLRTVLVQMKNEGLLDYTPGLRKILSENHTYQPPMYKLKPY